MNKLVVSSIFNFIIVSLLFAQAQNYNKNAIGWDSGLSYRYYLNSKLWLSATLSGDIKNTKQYDTINQSATYRPNDSIGKSTSLSLDSTYNYTGSIKLEIGKEIYKISIIGIDVFGFGSYSYQNNRTVNIGNGYSTLNPRYTLSNPKNTISGGIGIEPKIWILNKFSLGTTVGAQYNYVFGTDYTNNITDINNYNNTNGVYSSQEIKTFGSISLTMALMVYFYF